MIFETGKSCDINNLCHNHDIKQFSWLWMYKFQRFHLISNEETG